MSSKVRWCGNRACAFCKPTCCLNSTFSAVFYPAALFTLSKFYTRSELGLRSAFFYGAALIASAFGSLFAAGIIAALDGTHGTAGWRYLFYVEGAVTIGAAGVIVLILPNFPANAPFLTPEQRLIAVRRLAEDVGTVDEDDPNAKWYGG